MISFFTSGNIYIALFVLVIGLAYFLLVFPKTYQPFVIKNQTRVEGFRFINAFIISLSVKKTAGGALEGIMGQLSEPLKREISQADTVDTLAVIEYLKGYFTFPLYEMFVTIVGFYTTQGGEILSMSALLLASLRRLEIDIQEKQLIAKRKLTNFVILWAMTVVVLLFTRFGIATMFFVMMADPMFVIGLGTYWTFLLYSIHVWLARYMQATSDA